jgi:hypothetical protein
MSETAQNDLYLLINSGNTDEPIVEEDDNFSDDSSCNKLAQALKTIERLEQKNSILRDKMVEVEVENDHFKS